MSGHLLLARHGQSIWNAEKRVTGSSDVALSPRGRDQAQRLADELADRPLAAVYASPLARARDTARLTAMRHGLGVVEVDALREMAFGVLEGRFRDERDPEAHAFWRARRAAPTTFRAPGGEDFERVFARVSPWVRSAVDAHRGATFLVVAHRNTNRMVLAAVLGWSFERAAAQRIRSDVFLDVDLDRASAIEVELAPRAPERGIAS